MIIWNGYEMEQYVLAKASKSTNYQFITMKILGDRDEAINLAKDIAAKSGGCAIGLWIYKPGWRARKPFRLYNRHVLAEGQNITSALAGIINSRNPDEL